MDTKYRNFLSLKAEFHDKGKALRGFNNVMSHVSGNKVEELTYLLRFNHPKGVYGQELIERFEVDSLIEYYNLLLVATFAGYIPGRLEPESLDEIVTILDHPSVRPYYAVHYEYKMTDCTLQFAKQNRVYAQELNPHTLTVFNEFISLNRILKRDRDIERFLGMLDFVLYENSSIEDVNQILASYSKLNETFLTKERSEADSGVWGFVKFAVFLTQFKELLIQANDYPLIQSSCWMFHGYYFDRMSHVMKGIFDKAFHNLEHALSEPEIFKSIITDAYNTNWPEGIGEEHLINYSKNIINQAREDLEFVLDKRWSLPLLDYLKN